MVTTTLNGNARLNVTLVARTESRTTGLARYAYGLYDRYAATGRSVALTAPLGPPLPGALYSLAAGRGIDLRTFFKNYPVRAAVGGSDICHITSQNLATLLRVRRMPPAVVTVHDLYYLIERADRQKARGSQQWADRLAMAGVMRAWELIAISEFTKQTIVDLLHYPEERISVIHRSIDASVFRPLTVPCDFRARYGLPEGAPLILYVGSEDPRKNLPVLVEAFRQVHARVPDAVLVKAGAVHFKQEAARIRQQVEDLGIAPNVVFIEDLPDRDLPYLYNTADIFVIPSLFEGFGLPALEAMACGRPVIAANAGSLPEVVGKAGVLFDPNAPDDLARSIVGLIDQPDRRRKLGELGLARSRAFSPAREAERTWEVYRRIHEQRSMRHAE